MRLFKMAVQEYMNFRDGTDQSPAETHERASQRTEVDPKRGCHATEVDAKSADHLAEVDAEPAGHPADVDAKKLGRLQKPNSFCRCGIGRRRGWR